MIHERNGALHYYDGDEDRARFPLPKTKPKVYSYDPVDRELYCDGKNGDLRRYDAERRTWKKVRLTTLGRR